MACERLQGEEQFHSKNCLLKMPCSNVKLRSKSAPQKLNFSKCRKLYKNLCTRLWLQMPLHVPT